VRNIAFILFLFLSNFCSGQVDCLPESCTRWTYKEIGDLGGLLGFSHIIGSGSYDTIIGSAPYMKLKRTFSTSSGVDYVGSVRAENDSLFYLSPDDTLDRLLWDFNALPGDTLVVYRSGANFRFKVVVDSVGYKSNLCANTDSILGHFFTRLQLDMGGGFFPDTVGPLFYSKKWGGNQGLFVGESMPSVSGGRFLSYVSSKDSSMVDSLSSCYVTHCNFPIGIEEFSKRIQSIYPNPAQAANEITIKGDFKNQVSYSIFDINGKETQAGFQQSIYQGQFSLILDLLKPGLYLIAITDELGIRSTTTLIIK
jgi:hypothetical protein